jgi:hypothetical protein
MGHKGFIARWTPREGGQERANYALFLGELCDLLGVARPEPAEAKHECNDYVFERLVQRQGPDGKPENGRIDLYKRGHFILEAKQAKVRDAKTLQKGQGDLFAADKSNQAHGTLDHVMIQARRQAERYAISVASSSSMPISRDTAGITPSFPTP